MKKSIILWRGASALGGLLLLNGAAQAQTQTPTNITAIAIPAPGTTYTQNFNTLAATGTSSAVPAGFAFAETGTNAVYTAGTGSSATGDTYSFGTAAASTDRAFGTLLSSTNFYKIGAVFTNTSTSTLASITISYTGEQYRLGATNREDRLDFQYRVGVTNILDTTFATATDVDALDFVAPVTTGTVGLLDGNATANKTLKSATITIPGGLAPNASIAIRFNDFNATGSDDGLAIDDFNLSAIAAVANEVVFSPATASAVEGSGSATVTVTRGSGTGTATVDFATADGTATSGTDYTATTGTVSFMAGETSKSIIIPLLNDSVVEANETFTVTLSNPGTGTTIGTASTATVTILEDDRAPLIVINEIKKDAPNGADTPTEYIELRGTPGALLTNVQVVFVPGDSGFPGSFGQANKVFNLTGQTLGTNGLLVIQSPAGPATTAGGTTIVTDTDFNGAGQGAFFDGTGTFFLNLSPTPVAEGSELDGSTTAITATTVTFPAGTSTIDSIGFSDGDAGDSTFGTPALALPGTGAENIAPDAASRFPSDDTANSAAAFFFGELVGAANTSLDYDETTPGTTVSANFPAGYDLTPGALNILPVVAPSGPQGYAVAGNSLYRFPLANPSAIVRIGVVGAIGFTPEGIDFNPANGLLYALDIGATRTQLYTIDITNGTATTVGAGFLNAGTGTNGPPSNTPGDFDLTGDKIGFDFNPKTLQGDGSIRIRVTSDDGDNIRLRSDNGLVANVDGKLTAGQSLTSIVGAAYTSNVAQMTGGAGTMLFDVSDIADMLYLQSPPNNGTLMERGDLIAANSQPDTGFDIFTGESGTGGVAYLSTDNDAGGAGPVGFFTVDLADGEATSVGNFGAIAVSDIAIQPLAAGAGVPFVRSITRATGTNNPTASPIIRFTVTFSEAVDGVDGGDFTLTTTGSTGDASITGITDEGNGVFTVTVSNFTGNGTIRLNVIDNGSITDFETPANELGGPGAGNGNFTTGETITIALAATTGAIISEFRFRGPGGSLDEYVEIANKTGSPLNISGWKIRTNTSLGKDAGGNELTPTFQISVVPDNKIIPPLGRFLFTGPDANFSLKTYAFDGPDTDTDGAGPDTDSDFGTKDAAITGDAADDSGVALFNAQQDPDVDVPQDAVDFASSASGQGEGAPLPVAPTENLEFAFVRDFINSELKDTDDNLADFRFVSSQEVNGTDAGTTTDASGTMLQPIDGINGAGGAGTLTPRQGAPGPQGLLSPLYRNNQITNTQLEAGSSTSPANRRIIRNQTPNGPETPTGRVAAIIVRRTLTNTTNTPITRIRLTATRITSRGTTAGPGIPSSPAIVTLVSSDFESVSVGGTMVDVFGTTLEANATGLPLSPAGGGMNSSLTLSEPIPAKDSRNFSFRLNIVRNGTYTVAFNVEALPTVLAP